MLAKHPWQFVPSELLIQEKERAALLGSPMGEEGNFFFPEATAGGGVLYIQGRWFVYMPVSEGGVSSTQTLRQWEGLFPQRRVQAPLPDWRGIK